MKQIIGFVLLMMTLATILAVASYVWIQKYGLATVLISFGIIIFIVGLVLLSIWLMQ